MVGQTTYLSRISFTDRFQSTHFQGKKVAAHLSMLDNYQVCKWLSVTIHQQGTVWILSELFLDHLF